MALQRFTPSTFQSHCSRHGDHANAKLDSIRLVILRYHAIGIAASLLNNGSNRFYAQIRGLFLYRR